MALSQKGASYVGRDFIKDQYVLGALDDLASQIQATRDQGSFGPKGAVSPPSQPTALQVSSTAKLFTATIIHPNAPAGTQWHLQYSTSPNFQLEQRIDVIVQKPVFQAYLPGANLYWRVAAKVGASENSAWTYLGSSAQPQVVS